MPLHGKIVVIKRSGGDGTEFPLTASCLFGRKADCDIRIQLPQVSKEHCRIDLNENKEVILTNLSSVNPTRVNGDALQQSERLKHGDLITIIDRSFRFEYPPAPTPKKRSSAVNKSETLQVLQDQQVREISTVSTEENKKSDLTSDFCLKDGTNIVKLQQSDKSSELESKEDGIVDKNNPSSPFCELYEMVKQSFDSKTPRKTSGSRPQTPASRFCTPKSVSTRKVEKLAIPTNVENTPKTSEVGERIESEMTVKSFEKESLPVQTAEMNVEAPSEIKPVEDATLATPIRETPKRRKRSSLPRKSTAIQSNTTPVTRPTPQKLTASEVAESLTMKKTPTRRISKESDARAEEPQLPTDSVISTDDQTKVAVESRPSTPKTEPPCSPRISPRTAQKKLQAQDVLQELEKTTAPVSSKKRSGDVNLSVPKGKRKRVSFGGNLSPELFDKRLPPNSPLQKGSTPLRRSLCVPQKKQSLLRRASVIGLIKEQPIPESCKPKGSPGSKASPKRPASSSKTPSPAKKSPKAKTPSPAKARSPSPAKKSPKAKTPSPAKAKTPSPSKTKSPKIKTKTPTPEKRQTKSSPGKKSPSKDVPLTPKAQKSPKTVTTTSKSPLSSSANQTPTVKGRFSISRISTPSPTAERGPVPQMSVIATPGATPKVRRKSMKSVKKSAAKGALAVMRNRRSGVSRASMKIVGSWADIVKFGPTKSQTVAPTKKTTIKGTTTKKVVVPKPKTPAKKPKEHASTGHADSPMTIVVGRAHKMKVVEPTAGAPKLVPNMAMLRKNMKMDEDLTGVAEIFTTPACPRQRNSVAKAQQSDIKTPQRNQSLIETSVMNTPEETGEMVVSPLSVASTAKRGKYNTDAVSRLFQDNQDSSFITKDSAHEEAEVGSDTDHAIDKSSEDSHPEMSTPKQKPEQPDCLTGVKRIMKTPKQKMEPVEDLRGKLLKTPRAPKLFEEVEFDGMTELLETPKQKGKPSDDLPGLKEATETPLVESTPSLCATVIQRVMKTPKEKATPVEDMIGVKRLMQTPKVKGVPVVDMVGVKRIMKTPKQKSESVENNFGIDRLMKSPVQKNCAGVEDLEGLQELVQEPVQDESIAPDVATEQPEVCLDYTESGSENDMQTVSPIEADEPSQLEVTEENNLEPGEPDVVGEEQTENAPALSEDMVTVSETDDVDPPQLEVVDPPQLEVTEEKDLATEEPHKVCEEHTEDLSCSTPSDDMQTVSQTETVEPPQLEVTKDTDLATEEPHVVCKAQTEDVPAPAEDIQTVSQTVAVEPPELDVTEEKVEASKDTSIPLKTTECITEETAQDPEPITNEEHETELTGVVSAAAPEVPVRGRRGKKTDLAVQTPVRQSKRSRVTAQIDLSNHTEAPVEVSAPVEKPLPEPAPASKPKRGRKTKQPSVDEAETVHGEAETVHENTAESANDAIPETEMADVQNPTSDVVSVKQRGGRKTKQSATKPAAVVSVARAKRGRMVQKESVENEPEVVAIPQKESVETSAPVEKPRRGRKVKQDSVEQAEESVVKPPVTEKEEAQVPVSKPKRGRRTKPDSVEPVEEPSAESTTADALVCQDPTIMAAKNPKRGGRRPKQNAVEQVDEPIVESDGAEQGVQEETTIAPEKPKRGGRKTKQNPEVEAAPAPTNDIPVEKPKRGRRTKQDVQTEKAQEEAMVPRPKPARGRRAAAVAKDEVVQEAPVKRGRRGASVSRVEATNADAAVPVTKSATRGKAGKVNKDVTDVPAEVQPEPVLRGRRGAKSAKVAAVETTVALITEVIPVEEDVAVTKEEVKKRKGRFSRKGKADSETVIDRADDTENIPESDVNKTMSSKKSVNWKAQLEVTHEFQNVTPVPVKASRGRRAKTNTEEASAAETTALKAGNKRKMVRSVSKAEEADPLEAVPAEPVKRARRGAKSTYAAPLADITSASVDVTDASSEAPKVIESAKGRGKTLRKGKALSADIEQTEEVQETKPRRGRAGKK